MSQSRLLEDSRYCNCLEILSKNSLDFLPTLIGTFCDTLSLCMEILPASDPSLILFDYLSFMPL